MPLCPTCHRNLPHRLFAPAEAPILAAAAKRWERLVEISKLSSSAREWRKTVDLLLAPEMRIAALSLGAYEFVEARAAVLLHARPDAESDLLALRLCVLMAEMASYVRRTEEMSGLLAVERRRSLLPELDLRDRNRVALSLAKICHETGDAAGEQNALEAYTPAASSSAEFSFRKASFTLRLGQPIEHALAAPWEEAISLYPPAVQIPIANVLADEARSLLMFGEVERAYYKFTRSFLIGRRAFHRRGMLFAGMRLADTALRLGEAQVAANWWLIADQFRSAAVHPELPSEALRQSIVAAGGERIFHTAKADWATMASMLSPQGRELLASL
jgi:hypothetical protein